MDFKGKFDNEFLDEFEDEFSKPFVMSEESVNNSLNSYNVADDLPPDAIAEGLFPYKRYWKGHYCSILQFWLCSLVTVAILYSFVLLSMIVAVFVPHFSTLALFANTVYLFGLLQIISFIQSLRQYKHHKGETPFVVLIVLTFFTLPFTFIYIYPVTVPTTFLVRFVLDLFV